MNPGNVIQQFLELVEHEFNLKESNENVSSNKRSAALDLFAYFQHIVIGGGGGYHYVKLYRRLSSN